MIGEDARWLVEGARQLLDTDVAVPPGVAEQAVATLARQALEGQLGELCRRWDPQWVGVHYTATLLCLPVALGNPGLPVRVSRTWKQLTLVCHHRPSAPAPTHGDLNSWLDTVEEFLAATPALPDDLHLEITLDARPRDRAPSAEPAGAQGWLKSSPTEPARDTEAVAGRWHTLGGRLGGHVGTGSAEERTVRAVPACDG